MDSGFQATDRNDEHSVGATVSSWRDFTSELDAISLPNLAQFYFINL